jgi:hypothetical protein
MDNAYDAANGRAVAVGVGRQMEHGPPAQYRAALRQVWSIAARVRRSIATAVNISFRVD